jgi:hypothetical protein
VLVLAASVQAVPIPTVVIDPVKDNANPIEFALADHSSDPNNPYTIDGEGLYNFVGSYESPDWSVKWNVEVSGEAWRASHLFIHNVWEWENTLNTPADVGFTLTLPGTVPGPTAISGSVSGSVADTSEDGNGASITENGAGDPIYTALIDSVPVRTLVSAPFTFTAPGWLTNPWDGGDFIGEGGHPAVNLGITIQHDLRLSALDGVTTTATFLVVPEPATIAFLLIGGSALAFRRRR